MCARCTRKGKGIRQSHRTFGSPQTSFRLHLFKKCDVFFKFSSSKSAISRRTGARAWRRDSRKGSKGARAGKLFSSSSFPATRTDEGSEGGEGGKNGTPVYGGYSLLPPSSHAQAASSTPAERHAPTTDFVHRIRFLVYALCEISCTYSVAKSTFVGGA